MWFHHSKRNDAIAFCVKNTKEIFNMYILGSPEILVECKYVFKFALALLESDVNGVFSTLIIENICGKLDSIGLFTFGDDVTSACREASAPTSAAGK